ncbi:site-specific recombinase XerD [Dysgonomonas hofstadii]|uniref:Site-specific recombinase XerD n=1 Tax=Dysgonomonas hofstadii TaxID=637886 RepID=A0A840CJC9_9BACT|nr:site-specific recombinase XerD [Dysgonomonas hofstadii]
MRRHTFATIMLTKGVSIESVSKMLGHTNITTTQIYARVLNQKIKEEVNKVSKEFNDMKEFYVQ